MPPDPGFSPSATAASRTVRDELKGAGVYGAARSYSEEPLTGTADTEPPPPYFFRGCVEELTLGPGTLHAPASATILSEEFELVLVARRDRRGVFEWVGYTFGNDLTDLGEFRRDAARIQHAKTPKAGLCPLWWEGSPPAALPVLARRVRGEAVDSYTTLLGTRYVPCDVLLTALNGFAGVTMFEHILVFSGAPRGFAWREDPVRSGDVLMLEVEGFGEVLRHRVEQVDP
jgi:hypothetical protein